MPVPSEIHVGDVGTAFRTVVRDQDGDIVDISEATEIQILFASPTGTTTAKTARFGTDGSDGVMEYVTTTGDLPVAGTWQVQAFVQWADGQLHGNVSPFKVEPNLTAS